MPRDTFDMDYTCQDCGREHLSINAMMQCPCYKITRYGYPVIDDDDLTHPFTD